MAIGTQTRTASPRRARAEGEELARSRGFEWLARAGFVARGVVYALIGILAIKLADGTGSRQADQEGALKTIAAQPFGKVLLVLVAIGLAGYALWRLVRAALGHGPEGSDSGLDRVAAGASGVAYAGVCALAVEILLGDNTGSSSQKVHSTTAGILGWPGGTWLVGAAGVVLGGVGLYQGYRGIARDFLEDSKVAEMSPGVRTAFEAVAIVGHLARMVVFGLVGAFLVKSAVEYDPQTAVGLDGALARLERASYGPYLLGVVAAGLLAFALYSLADARYRRI